MPLMRRLPQNAVTGQEQSQPSIWDALALSPAGMAVGGLPEGLNPSAIRMLLKQMNIEPLAEEVTPNLPGLLGGLTDEAGRSLGAGAFSPAVGATGLNEFAPIARPGLDSLLADAKRFGIPLKQMNIKPVEESAASAIKRVTPKFFEGLPTTVTKYLNDVGIPTEQRMRELLAKMGGTGK